MTIPHPDYPNIEFKPTIAAYDWDQTHDLMQVGFYGYYRIIQDFLHFENIPAHVAVDRYTADNFPWAENWIDFFYDLIKTFSYNSLYNSGPFFYNPLNFDLELHPNPTSIIPQFIGTQNENNFHGNIGDISYRFGKVLFLCTNKIFNEDTNKFDYSFDVLVYRDTLSQYSIGSQNSSHTFQYIKSLGIIIINLNRINIVSPNDNISQFTGITVVNFKTLTEPAFNRIQYAIDNNSYYFNNNRFKPEYIVLPPGNITISFLCSYYSWISNIGDFYDSVVDNNNYIYYDYPTPSYNLTPTRIEKSGYSFYLKESKVLDISRYILNKESWESEFLPCSLVISCNGEILDLDLPDYYEYKNITKYFKKIKDGQELALSIIPSYQSSYNSISINPDYNIYGNPYEASFIRKISIKPGTTATGSLFINGTSSGGGIYINNPQDNLTIEYGFLPEKLLNHHYLQRANNRLNNTDNYHPDRGIIPTPNALNFFYYSPDKNDTYSSEYNSWLDRPGSAKSIMNNLISIDWGDDNIDIANLPRYTSINNVYIPNPHIDVDYGINTFYRFPYTMEVEYYSYSLNSTYLFGNGYNEDMNGYFYNFYTDVLPRLDYQRVYFLRWKKTEYIGSSTITTVDKKIMLIDSPQLVTYDYLESDSPFPLPLEEFSHLIWGSELYDETGDRIISQIDDYTKQGINNVESALEIYTNAKNAIKESNYSWNQWFGMLDTKKIKEIYSSLGCEYANNNGETFGNGIWQDPNLSIYERIIFMLEKIGLYINKDGTYKNNG
jgi:hypothetical protein